MTSKQKLAHAVDDDGHVTVSGRAYYALDAARGHAARVAGALERLEAAASHEDLVEALRDLCTLGKHLNERALRALEYIRLDGEGGV